MYPFNQTFQRKKIYDEYLKLVDCLENIKKLQLLKIVAIFETFEQQFFIKEFLKENENFVSPRTI